MRNWKMLYLPLAALFIQVVAVAQNIAAGAEENVGLMRSNGKIYVVVAILLTILAGLIFYVARLDVKISKLEKEG